MLIWTAAYYRRAKTLYDALMELFETYGCYGEGEFLCPERQGRPEKMGT